MSNFPSVTGGGSGSASMASVVTIGSNGNWFIDGKDTGNPSSREPNLQAFKQGEVVTVDAKTGKLAPSGVFADKGELTVEPDSVIIGSHELSSSAENIAVTNLATNKIYSPLWQEIAPDVKHAYIREHGPMEKKVRYIGTTRLVTNPEFDIVMDEDSTVFTLETFFDYDTTNLVLETYLGKEKLYRATWDKVAAGSTTLTLKTPADFKKGETYRVKLFSPDGDVNMRGGATSAPLGIPKWVINRVLWKDVEIATKEWVNDYKSLTPALWGAGRPAPFDQDSVDMSTMSKDDFINKLIIASSSVGVQTIYLPKLGGGVVEPGDKITISNQTELTGGWVVVSGKAGDFVGSVPLVYLPAGATIIVEAPLKGGSWVTLASAGGMNAGVQTGAPTPNSYGPAHTMKPITQIMADSGAGEIVDTTTGGNALLIKDTSVKSMVFNPNNDELTVTSETGRVTTVTIPAGKGTVSTPVTTDEIAKAMDHGIYVGSGSLKTLEAGWWIIPDTNTQVTGKPKGSQGDLIVYKQGSNGPLAKAGFGVMLAFGKDGDNKDSVWAEYRDGLSWTPWFKVNDGVGSTDLTTVNQAINTLQTREAALTNEVGTLTTSVGNIFAPSRIAFDKEVEALITAKLASFKPASTPTDLTKVNQEIAANTQTIASQEARLAALENAPRPSGGGTIKPVHTLPRIYAVFGLQTPTSLTANNAVTSTNGKATLLRIPTSRARIFVLVENDNGEANRVQGISVDGGMAAAWQPKDIVIDGKKFRSFYSAGSYTEKSVTIKVNFG